MYRFLMVDDEEIVRRGFETKIDWVGQGFEFLPPCENGRDAIAAIDELRPDIVMTDIHMPHADGISVAAHVMERYPDIVVVILSGYDEFGYAQAAIRNNVFDYVLKPVSSRDLTGLLAKIKAKLDADRRSREDESALRLKADVSSDILRERSLAEFLIGSSPPPDASEAEGLLGFFPDSLACAAIVAECDKEERAASATDDIRERIAKVSRLARRSASFSPSEGRVAVIVFEPGTDRCAKVALAMATALLDEGRSGLRVAVGRSYELWIDAPRAYAEATAALAYRLVRDPVRPFFYVQTGENRDALAELKSREERLCLAVRTGASARVPELARSYTEAMDRADLSPLRLRHEVLSLFSRVQDELAKIGVSPAALSVKLACDYYRYAESLGSPEEISIALVRLAVVAVGILEASSLHEPEWKVLDFKDYIARHYADKGISIGKAADRLSISESYLSKLLRRRLETSFVEYLSDYRIDRAKELIATSDMLAYEVAEAVGYPDARYFASLFKKRTGMTPSEYRKSLGAKE
ncbi:MAG: helix-turn-helix domain-containing protein [Rectinemataceae bacterium]|jgi:two-component system response regulator YesN